MFAIFYGTYSALLYVGGVYYLTASIAAYLTRSVFRFWYVRKQLFRTRIPGRAWDHLKQHIPFEVGNFLAGNVLLALLVEVAEMDPLIGQVAAGLCTFIIAMILTRYVFKP